MSDVTPIEPSGGTRQPNLPGSGTPPADRSPYPASGGPVPSDPTGFGSVQGQQAGRGAQASPDLPAGSSFEDAAIPREPASETSGPANGSSARSRLQSDLTGRGPGAGPQGGTPPTEPPTRPPAGVPSPQAPTAFPETLSPQLESMDRTHADESNAATVALPESTAAASSGNPPANASSGAEAPGMQVSKRDGSLEPVDLNKIVRAVSRCAEGLADVDPMRIATRTISGLYDGATTSELDRLSIQTAASLTAEEPSTRRLAARLLGTYIDKEVQNQEIHSFSQSIRLGHELGIINDQDRRVRRGQRRKLNDTIEAERGNLFEYFGLRTVYDRYLLKHPSSARRARDAAVLLHARRLRAGQSPSEARDFYRLISSLRTSQLADALQLGHAAPAALVLLPARLAAGRPRGDLRPLPGHRAAVEVRGRHRRCLPPRSLTGSLIRGTNGQSQRHRAVAQDARQLRRRRQPGRPPQGRGVRVPRDLARRHRGLP